MQKDMKGSEDIAPQFLISTLMGAEFQASRHEHFIPEEVALVTYWISDWMVTGAFREAVKRRKISGSSKESKTESSVILLDCNIYIRYVDLNLKF
jgi:hypothetical protein